MAAMTKKEKNAEKNRRLREREQKREKLTNWYMINLCYGILAIIAVLILRALYLIPKYAVHMQLVAWIITAVFAVGALVVLALGLSGKIENKSRARNYAIFLGVCALGGLWLALYNKIRFYAELALQSITGNSSFTINSHWNVNLLIFGIIAYLILAFIYYVIKLYRVR